VLAGDDALAAQDLAVPYNGPTGQNEYAEVEYQYRDSYYVEDRLSAWHNRVFLAAGMRWYHSRNTSQDLTQAAGPVSETDFAPFEAENLGIVVKPVSWLSAYYSHVTTQIPLSGYGIGPTGPPFLLLPEDGKDNEVGVKLDYKYSRYLSVWGDWDHFYESLTNVRIPGLPGEVNDITGAPVVIQSAQNNSAGWELDLGARLSNDIVDTDLIVTAYRAFTSAAAQNFGQAYNAVGDTFSVLGKFTFKEGPKGLFLGASGNQVGKKFQGDYILETPNMYKAFAGYIINKNWTVQVNWDDVSNDRYPIYIDTVASVQVAPAGEISFVSKFRW
jgi:outer membrane receptor for ferric coprogen and ferric-rhodotorulic acid